MTAALESRGCGLGTKNDHVWAVDFFKLLVVVVNESASAMFVSMVFILSAMPLCLLGIITNIKLIEGLLEEIWSKSWH